jgi:NAD(P)H dehydrogenase (quinone)
MGRLRDPYRPGRLEEISTIMGVDPRRRERALSPATKCARRRSKALRVLILYANPVVASFGAALHKQVVSALQSRGHQTDDCDLYAESFDPVMGEQERIEYHDTNQNKAGIAGYASRLLAAEALVLVYPVWNEGFPAILKGFFDRVFIPGVSFKIGADGAAAPNLQKLRKLAAVCTYGASRATNFLLGDPPKRVVKRLVRAMPGHSVRCDYLALYDMDHVTPEQRAAFLEKVKRVFEAW